jgi:hypothetical protein
MRRRSILVNDDLDRRVQRQAQQRGTTYTEVVREALEKHVDECDENPGQWLLDLGDEIKEIIAREGLPNVPRFPIDSDEARLQMARDRWRHKFGREPDF